LCSIMPYFHLAFVFVPLVCGGFRGSRRSAAQGAGIGGALTSLHHIGAERAVCLAKAPLHVSSVVDVCQHLLLALLLLLVLLHGVHVAGLVLCCREAVGWHLCTARVLQRIEYDRVHYSFCCPLAALHRC
jgi:hypothetical protein